MITAASCTFKFGDGRQARDGTCENTSDILTGCRDHQGVNGQIGMPFNRILTI